jgi:2-polyprenyl-3-methyl-5-hydroxy-6-metoxy-1,4-benzoquinol methylase
MARPWQVISPSFACDWAIWLTLPGSTGEPIIRDQLATFAPLTPAPTTFFMTIRDVAFWLRSARADARLNRYRDTAGIASAFDQLYGVVADPFGTELPQYRYQQRKYECLLSMLPQRRYRQVLDIGCGLGAFTRKLAPFADRVLGTDISDEALQQARKLSADWPNVAYARNNVVDPCEEDRLYDLIILADTLYYIDALTDERLKAIARNIASKLLPGGLILVVNHYFFGIDAASRSTRAIHDAFRSATNLTWIAEHRRAFFLATLLQCNPDT